MLNSLSELSESSTGGVGRAWRSLLERLLSSLTVAAIFTSSGLSSAASSRALCIGVIWGPRCSSLAATGTDGLENASEANRGGPDGEATLDDWEGVGDPREEPLSLLEDLRRLKFLSRFCLISATMSRISLVRASKRSILWLNTIVLWSTSIFKNSESTGPWLIDFASASSILTFEISVLQYGKTRNYNFAHNIFWE